MAWLTVRRSSGNIALSSKEKLFSVTIHDCEVQVFRAGGNGGQGQNTTDTGVRVIHHPSHARGECRETRSQLENKRRAFKRMAESPLFKSWVAVQTGRIKSDDQIQQEVVDELSNPANLRIEVKVNGKWTDTQL